MKMSHKRTMNLKRVYKGNEAENEGVEESKSKKKKKDQVSFPGSEAINLDSRE